MFLNFEHPFTQERFVSFVILSYKRPDYTHNLVNSIHRFCDFPFEIIVHDDHSDPDTVNSLISLRDRVSTLILGGSEYNMGLASSFNRGIALATSKYVICLNNDIEMKSSGIGKVLAVLEIPYIGILGPLLTTKEGGPEVGDPHYMRVVAGGQGFSLSSYCGSGSIMAFRKSVWQEVGGFPQLGCGSSDVGGMMKVLHNGYFNAHGLYSPEELFENADAATGCLRSTIGPNKYDGAYPTIFKGPDLDDLNQHRRTLICNITRDSEHSDEGYANGAGWIRYYDNAFKEAENNFDWDKLTYHKKWKDLVESHRVRR